MCCNNVAILLVNNTTCIKSAKLKFGNMFQLQGAIIRPKTERSPGTFSDGALHGNPYNPQF
jgi:hypothetical protein